MNHKIQKLYTEARYFFLNISLVEKNILYPRYKKYISNHRKTFPHLPSEDVEILKALEENGIYITSLDALGVANTDNFLSEAKKLSEDLEKTSQLPENQGRDKIRATAAQFVQYSSIFYWGLEQRLLDIAESYIKVPVAYGYPTFAHHIAANSHKRSGNWHRDREDRRMMKIGIYLSDVNEDSGPFQYVRPDIASLVFDRVQAKYPLRKTYKTFIHREFENLVSDIPDWFRSCTGPAGTVVFFDPVRFFHRGMPPTKFNRFALFYSYHSRKPSYPFFCSQSLSHFSRKDLQSLIKRLSVRQQDCVDWDGQISMNVNSI